MAILPRILAFAGSARRASLNRQLLAVAVAETRAAGAEVTVVDLNELTLPLYHGDLEEAEGLPPGVTRLAGLAATHHGLLIASPEYNASLTPLLKNTLDWLSRVDDDPFPGKVAAVVSASPGALGGVRSQLQARQLLLQLGCHVTPAQCQLPKAHEAFDDAGGLKDPRALKSVRALARQLVEMTIRLGA